MQKAVSQRRWWLRWAAAAAAVAVLALLWPAVRTLLEQLLAGYVLMLLALPVCRVLEKRISPSMAATLAFAGLAVAAAALLLGLIPPLVEQFRQLSAAFPALIEGAKGLLNRLQAWLTERGVDLAPVRDEAFTQAGRLAGSVASWLAGSAARAAQAVGKLFLAPLFAFYLLRDRRKICAGLVMLLPVQWRQRAVRAAREMRRETVGYLRGQLLVSAAVGAMTAIGLLATGNPGWLVFGLLMGVMELIPYIGPWLAGAPAVLLALQRGWPAALWTLGIIVLVQQLEGGILSPRLMSTATRLHPLAVLMAITAGGILGGTLGMLMSLPIVVSCRGALRGLREA